MFELPKNARPYNNCFLVVVTPALAERWLLKNSFNRSIGERLIENYARQMIAGNWRRTHQGIAFDEEGVVIDGQHRLHAVIRSGKSVPMLVFLNEKQSIHEALDGGKHRTLLDVVRLELLDDTIKRKYISVLRAMIAGRNCRSQNHLSATEIIDLYRRYHQAVIFAVSVCEHFRMNDTTIMAVHTRATLSVQKDHLVEFCQEFFAERSSHPSARLIATFRTWHLSIKDRREATRREIYKRTEILLMSFLTGETCSDHRSKDSVYFKLNSNFFIH